VWPGLARSEDGGGEEDSHCDKNRSTHHFPTRHGEKHMTNQGTGGELLQRANSKAQEEFMKKSRGDQVKFLCMAWQKLAARFSFPFLVLLSTTRGNLILSLGRLRVSP
jgi:hypothetical protein